MVKALVLLVTDMGRLLTTVRVLVLQRLLCIKRWCGLTALAHGALSARDDQSVLFLLCQISVIVKVPPRGAGDCTFRHSTCTCDEVLCPFSLCPDLQTASLRVHLPEYMA